MSEPKMKRAHVDIELIFACIRTSVRDHLCYITFFEQQAASHCLCAESIPTPILEEFRHPRAHVARIVIRYGFMQRTSSTRARASGPRGLPGQDY